MEKQAFQTSGKEQFSYFGFFLGQNIIYAIVYQYLGFFFTEGIGINAIKVATMLAIPKIWDAINDPIMGVIVDKAHLKRGKFLPWIKFVVYALPLITILLFIDMTPNKQLMLVLFYILYTSWGMIYTVGDVPAFSIATVMTDKLPERDRLMSLGRLGAVVGVLAAAAFLSLKGAVGFTYTIIIYMAVSFVFMIPINFLAKERVPYTRSENIPLKTIFSQLFKNKYLLIYYLAFFAATAANTLQFIAAYFAKANLGDEGLTTLILAATVVPLLAVIPFLPAMIKAVGKRQLTIWCSALFIVFSVIQYFVGYDSLVLFIVFAAIRVILMNIPLQMYGMFTADCVEYGAYKSGERTEGISFAIQTFMTKLGGAVVQWVSLFVIGIAGYIEQLPAGQMQPASALNAIWQVMTLIPIAGFAIMLVIMVFFYDLKETDVQKMIDEMSAKSAK
mgnify:CR=1 FL=1